MLCVPELQIRNFGEMGNLSNFSRGLAKEHLCEIISKSVHQFSSRRLFKTFFLFIALAAILFNKAEQFEQFWWIVT